MTVVEIFYFEGCPGHAAAAELVARVVKDAALNVEVRHVEVANAVAAEQLRFLGSPTVRVDGVDVDPDADQRHDFAMQCRVYSVNGRLQNAPRREWIERALGVAR